MFILRIIPWGVVGAAGLLLLGGRLLGAEGAAAPPAKAAAPEAAQAQAAEKLIAELLAPVPAAEPTPEQKVALDKLLKDFASESFQTRQQAAAAAVKLGPAALSALRQATRSKDLEVALLAEQAVAGIEKAAREAAVAELRKLSSVSVELLTRKLELAKRTWANLTLGAAEADRKDDPERARKLRADIDAADKCLGTLRLLLESVAPGGPTAEGSAARL